MTIKKFAIIAAAGALLLAGAIGISMQLTRPQEMELAVDAAQEEADGDLPKTLENMENMPLYYNDRDMLLLPLRNVMEGLGGTVRWDAEKRRTEISYRGKKLYLAPGETEATLNGYEITLPAAAETINDCLYVEEAVLTAYYTGDVVWDTDSKQIILQAKNHAVPIVAEKTLTGEANGRAYRIEMPVIVGLNDTNFEKSLHESIQKELLTMGDAFLAENAPDEQTEETEKPAAAATETETLALRLRIGWVSAEFISLCWEGESAGMPLAFTKNIDLVGQKTVSPADLLQESALQELRTLCGADDTQSLYLDADGALVLLYADAEGQRQEYRRSAESAAEDWKKAYRGIFGAAVE